MCTMLVDDSAASPNIRGDLPLYKSTPRGSAVSTSDEDELHHSPTSPSLSLFCEDNVTSDVFPNSPSMPAGMKRLPLFCINIIFLIVEQIRVSPTTSIVHNESSLMGIEVYAC